MEPAGKDSTDKKGKKNEEKGRCLPDDVLRQILSYLDMKYVVQTSILSKEWRYVWKSVPCLNFDCGLFHDENWEDGRFGNFVDNVLLRDDSGMASDIHSFCLSSYDDPEFGEDICDIESHLGSWIEAVLKRNVQHVYLNLTPPDSMGLPHCLFTCKSLKVLELRFSSCIFDLTPPDSTILPVLEILVLESVGRLDSDKFNKIFSSCPVLNSLTMIDCYFLAGYVEIHALNIKHLVISIDLDVVYFCDQTIIKLNAPNLISLCCKGSIFIDYFMENLSALVKAKIDLKDRQAQHWAVKFLRAFHNVKYLKLSVGFLKSVSGALSLLESKSIQLHKLRCLKMKNVTLSEDNLNAITYLLKICPNIESLFLDLQVRVNSDSTEILEVGVSLECMLDHLKLVDIRGVEGRLNELMFLEILLKKAMVLEKVVLHGALKEHSTATSRLVRFTEKLLTLPRASSSIAILLL